MEKLTAYSGLMAFIASFAITYFSIPPIIRLSLIKRLYDLPDSRKHHTNRISPLGGVAIFGGLMLSFIFFTAHLANPSLNSVLVALIILFITGVKDDLYPLTPWKKLGGQLVAVCIVVFQGDIRLESMYGLFEVYDLPYPISAAATIVFFLGIINSFNFIDGINGLSAGLGIVMSLTYAICLWVIGDELLLILALCIAGGQIAFLRYNLINARIFMGDSGSMVLGFFAALLTIGFLQSNQKAADVFLLHIDAMVFSFAVLIIPVFDTIRVIALRVFVLKKSPWNADRNHIHHMLLDLGLKHAQASMLLIFVNVFFILFTLWANDFVRAKYLLLALFIIAWGLSQIPAILLKRKS
jgi:UDP-N-acetylmuramyl pentapeptide phosphotransferase/UDP-N-acetylglucosamine-1-phosphate transferase